MAASDIEHLALAVKEKNRSINSLRIGGAVATAVLLCANGVFIALGFAWHYDDSQRLDKAGALVASQQRTINRQAQQTAANHALYCAQGTFFSALIRTSLDGGSSSLSPAAVDAIQKELATLDAATSANCTQ